MHQNKVCRFGSTPWSSRPSPYHLEKSKLHENGLFLALRKLKIMINDDLQRFMHVKL